ncbi:AAA family ATPase, partial [Halovivax sp.]|uniref:AAA family ATPase n=1 Tax=Halovivax sp. TaxID=1935978 RepID=UPI0025B9DD5E
MHLERLDLDDFGAFERARIDGLSDGLTVIAGPQRAGKTTFMEAVRRLGYGVSRGDDLPPAADRYALAATVVAEGRRYRVDLEGYAEPAVTPLDGGPAREAADLYGGLGEAHYRQLYAISLDELRRVPRGLDDDAALSAILLGAAYGDVLAVPEVRDALAAEAEDIGGVRGKGVYRMGEPMERIERGIEAREAAVAQVEAHERTSEERRTVDERIDEIDAELEALAAERTRLDAIAANRDDYRRLRELEARLEPVEAAALEAFPLDAVDEVRSLRAEHASARRTLSEAIGEFEAATGEDGDSAGTALDEATDAVETNGAGASTGPERLLAAAPAIREFAAERSGWRERV